MVELWQPFGLRSWISYSERHEFCVLLQCSAPCMWLRFVSYIFICLSNSINDYWSRYIKHVWLLRVRPHFFDGFLFWLITGSLISRLLPILQQFGPFFPMRCSFFKHLVKTCACFVRTVKGINGRQVFFFKLGWQHYWNRLKRRSLSLSKHISSTNAN